MKQRMVGLMKSRSFLLSFLFIFASNVHASEMVSVTYYSNPEGAEIFADGKDWGQAPVTLKYKLTFKQLLKNTLPITPVTAKWKSGATKVQNLVIQPKTGKHQQFTIERPDVPNTEIDIKYGEVVKAKRLEQEKQARIKSNPHSLEALVQAIQAPIPKDMLVQARQVDDMIMKQGSIPGKGSIYLVTDKRSDRVNAIIKNLLNAMGEDEHSWVVRVIDTTPKDENAFVTAGKYIYVFTGLIDNAESDDELAFVLGHEIGHSVLKHYLRKSSDQSLQLTKNLAVIVAALSKKYGAAATAISQSMSNSYQRIDEEEADVFGAVVAKKAGYNPLKGTNFFVRLQKRQDAILLAAKTSYEQAQAVCSQWQNVWNTNPAIRTQQNANSYNATCNDANAKHVNYTLVQRAIQNQVYTSDHPTNQNRIAAVAAISDYLNGRRDLESMRGFTQSYEVLAALNAVKSPLLNSGHQRTSIVPPVEKTAGARDSEARLKKLEALKQKGLITQEEYTKKRQEIIDGL